MPALDSLRARGTVASWFITLARKQTALEVHLVDFAVVMLRVLRSQDSSDDRFE